MSAKLKLKGRPFGRLTALFETGERQDKKVMWFCRCRCGNYISVRSDRLCSGSTHSCGCLQRELSSKRLLGNRYGFKHGHNTKTSPTYLTWSAMIQRCRNPKNKWYKDYGGRGIRVCDRWKDFKNFLADMGKRPINLTIERKDNNGNYEPGNCKWATRKEQNNNRRKYGRSIEIRDEVKTIREWSEDKRCKVSLGALKTRLNIGWDPERAVMQE